MPGVVPGASLHEELHELVAADLAAEEAWLLATRRAGEFLDEPRLGTLQPGAPADLLIFRDDPTRDLAALATLEAVVVQGRLYTRQWLDDALSREREHFASETTRRGRSGSTGASRVARSSRESRSGRWLGSTRSDERTLPLACRGGKR
jgi:adenine deaminase